jgi:hypothetical protein
MTRSIIALCVVLVTTGYCGEPPYQVTKNLLADRFVFQPARPTAPTSLQDDFATGTGTKKSVPLATLYSLLLPGMGELYLDRYDIGKYFTMAEGGLWLTWGAFQMNGVWVRDDARRFAMQHAGTHSMNRSSEIVILRKYTIEHRGRPGHGTHRKTGKSIEPCACRATRSSITHNLSLPLWPLTM